MTGAQWGIRLAIQSILIVVVVYVGVYAALSHFQTKPFDPLVFPQQTVVSTVPGVPGPAVVEGHDLIVYATKCNEANGPVSVSGVSVWSEQNPPGDVVPAGSNAVVREPGCVNRVFSNAMPQGVIDRVRDLAANGVRQSQWKLTGTETPIHKGGVPKVWDTTTFTIVAR